MATNSTINKRTPIITHGQFNEITSIGVRSVIRICVSKVGIINNHIEGSAFLGETPDHQKALFTARHLFPFDEETSINVECANLARDTMFTIPLEEYDREKLFLLDDPDSAAIILNDDLVGRCQRAGSAFVRIGNFEPIVRPITILGFPGGGQLSLSTGWITEINDERFSHNAGTQPGNSGSLVLEHEENSMNVAGIHYASENEEQTGWASNINYIIHEILLRNNPCFPLPLSVPSMLELPSMHEFVMPMPA